MPANSRWDLIRRLRVNNRLYVPGNIPVRSWADPRAIVRAKRSSSSSSSSSSYICHGVGPLVDPFRTHVSRSLFKGKIMSIKSLITLPGIETTIFTLVAQSLNKLRHHVSPIPKNLSMFACRKLCYDMRFSVH